MSPRAYALTLAVLLWYVARCISKVKLRTAATMAPAIATLVTRVRMLKAVYWPHPLIGLSGLVHTVRGYRAERAHRLTRYHCDF